RPLNSQDTGHADAGRPEPLGKLKTWRNFSGQLSPRRSGGGDDHLGTFVEPIAAVIEGVDGGGGLEMKVLAPVHPLQDMAEEGGDVTGVQLRRVILAGDEEVLGQGELPLA